MSGYFSLPQGKRRSKWPTNGGQNGGHSPPISHLRPPKLLPRHFPGPRERRRGASAANPASHWHGSKPGQEWTPPWNSGHLVFSHGIWVSEWGMDETHLTCLCTKQNKAGIETHSMHHAFSLGEPCQSLRPSHRRSDFSDLRWRTGLRRREMVLLCLLGLSIDGGSHFHGWFIRQNPTKAY